MVSDFVTVYSCDQAPVTVSATCCVPSDTMSTQVVEPSATVTVTLVSWLRAAASEAAFLAAASESARCSAAEVVVALVVEAASVVVTVTTETCLPSEPPAAQERIEKVRMRTSATASASPMTSTMRRWSERMPASTPPLACWGRRARGSRA